MSLYWPEARVALSCAGATKRTGDEDWPSEVLVITMRPEQADDDGFVETVRELVLERTLRRRHEIVCDLLERGASMPEPRGATPRPGEEPTEGDEAERRLRERLMEDPDEGDERDEGPDDDDLGPDGDDWPWGCGGSGVLLGDAAPSIVINHCDEIFLRR